MVLGDQDQVANANSSSLREAARLLFQLRRIMPVNVLTMGRCMHQSVPANLSLV